MTAPQPELDSLWNFNDAAASEERFRACLADLASPDAAVIAEIQTQIARAQGLQRRFDDAHQTLDGVESHLTDLPPHTRVRYLLERGRVYNSSRKANLAKPLFEQAFAVARAEELDALAVDAAHMLAIVASGEEAIAWNMRALDMSKRSEDPKARKWRASLLNNLGWAHHDADRFDAALDCFEQAEQLRRDADMRGPWLIARWCIARAKRSLRRFDEALAEQQALLAEHQREGSGDGYVLEEIAECLGALGRSDDAAPFFAAAFTALSQDAWFAEREPARLARLAALGRIN